MKARLGLYGLMPIELFHTEGCTYGAVRVYTALASFQGTGDSCWPSRKAIMGRAGITGIGTYNTGLSWLKTTGWVQHEQRGLGQTNVYSVMVPCADVPEMGSSEEPKHGTSVYITKTNKENTTRKPGQLKDPLARFFEDEMDSYVNYGRERKHCNLLASRCRNRIPDDPEQAAKAMLAAFGWLRDHDSWWGRQPFIPSSLSSHWERIEADIMQRQSVEDASHSVIDEVCGDGS